MYKRLLMSAQNNYDAWMVGNETLAKSKDRGMRQSALFRKAMAVMKLDRCLRNVDPHDRRLHLFPEAEVQALAPLVAVQKNPSKKKRLYALLDRGITDILYMKEFHSMLNEVCEDAERYKFLRDSGQAHALVAAIYDGVVDNSRAFDKTVDEAITAELVEALSDAD